MGTWNNLQEGFTVDERLPDTLVDVAVWHVFNRAPQLYRQAPQIITTRQTGGLHIGYKPIIKAGVSRRWLSLCSSQNALTTLPPL